MNDEWPPDERSILDHPWPEDDEPTATKRDRFSVIVGEAREDGIRREPFEEAS
jgi:hypothetical protein